MLAPGVPVWYFMSDVGAWSASLVFLYRCWRLECQFGILCQMLAPGVPVWYICTDVGAWSASLFSVIFITDVGAWSASLLFYVRCWRMECQSGISVQMLAP